MDVASIPLTRMREALVPNPSSQLDSMVPPAVKSPDIDFIKPRLPRLFISRGMRLETKGWAS